MNGILTVAELDRQLGIPGVAKVSEGNAGLARVRITGAFGEGEVYQHGAHVTSWKPAGNEEVLFVSTKSRWEEGQAIRGGIPICFPWFRAKLDDPRAPAHGFVRTKMWQLESIIEHENGVAVTMFTHSDGHTRKWWPGEFRLVHRVTFGSELRLELVCMNTGTTPFRFEEALHTYNRIANIEDARLQGLDRVSYLDNTESNKEKTQSGMLSSPHRPTPPTATLKTKLTCWTRTKSVESGCGRNIRSLRWCGIRGAKEQRACKTSTKANGGSFSASRPAISWMPRSILHRDKSTEWPRFSRLICSQGRPERATRPEKTG